MKKSTFLNILRGVFCILFAAMAVFVFFHPKKTQTNILKAILSDSKEDQMLVHLSQKYSGRFNIIFEADDMLKADTAQKEFLENIDKQALQKDYSTGGEISDLLSVYKAYNRNLLSVKTKKEIKEHNFELVKLESLERLYNPLSINLLPLEEDPFMLFSDFLSMLASQDSNIINEFDGKYYSILKLNLKEEIALSPSLLNQEMSKVIKTKNKIEKAHKDIKIYLAGAPVHTYYASSKSMKEINLICILSSVFIILICKFYFRSFKLLLPIAISLSLGMLCGYMLTAIFFDSIHILTFVFSSTLIGICVDYSLHYFAHDNDIKLILKSLTMSMLTTVCAFLVLLFSGVELLKQIAVFTSGGLLCVYLFVVLFYPVFCKNIKPSPVELDPFLYLNKIPRKVKLFMSVLILIIAVYGLFKIHFNDEITDMYKPPKFLVNSEKLYALLNKNTSSPSFILVHGKDMQDILEKEENITEHTNQDYFYALSKFIPSIKQQKENQKLISLLYKRELNNYAAFLPKETRVRILNRPERKGFLTFDKVNLPMLKDFLIDDNTSVIVLKKAPPPDFIKFVVERSSDAKFIDLKNDISNKVKNCRLACLKLIIPALAALFLVMSVIYKPLNAIKIMAPSTIAGIFVIGLLSLLNIQINLFHVLALFLIAGFSLDYSIFRFSTTRNMQTSHLKSNWAVLISCATTVFSFLLLSMTSFKLISSLGFILSVGLTTSYILSLFLISEKSNESENETESI